MKHDDHVSAFGQSFAVAGLLIAAVTVVAIVLEDLQAEAACEIDGAVGAVVIDKNADIHEIRQSACRDLESFLRVIGGHDDRDAFAVDHAGEFYDT